MVERPTKGEYVLNSYLELANSRRIKRIVFEAGTGSINATTLKLGSNATKLQITQTNRHIDYL